MARTTIENMLPSGKIQPCSGHTTVDHATRKDQRMLKNIFQVAESCATDWQTVRDWIEDGTLPPPAIVGGFLRWSVKRLEQWTAEGCPQGQPLPEEKCNLFWDSLLFELKTIDQRKDSYHEPNTRKFTRA
jgi:predicted DNA-binding transcriptional regulator AlpA